MTESTPWTLETVATSIGSCHKIGPVGVNWDGEPTHACIYADGIRIGIDEGIPRAKELLRSAHMMLAAPELMAALDELQALVWGECPSLLDEDSGGSSRLALKIEDAIAKARGDNA